MLYACFLQFYVRKKEQLKDQELYSTNKAKNLRRDEKKKKSTHVQQQSVQHFVFFAQLIFLSYKIADFHSNQIRILRQKTRYYRISFAKSDLKSTCAVIISLTTAQNTSSLYAFIILGSDIFISIFLLPCFSCFYVIYNNNTT